jgi:hypothetical protein
MQHPHSFSIGQSVEVTPGMHDGNLRRGIYKILRLLPNDAEDREYRVRSDFDGHERVVRQSLLRPGPASPFG